MAKFSKANQKLAVLAQHLGMKKSEVVSFDLPAGFSCPAADICKTFANRQTGKMVKVGPITCYAAKAECQYPNTRFMRWYNLQMLADCGQDWSLMAYILETGLPKQAKIVRIHSSGDFFRPEYFRAWKAIASGHSEIVFFGYTKVMEYAIAEKSDNFHLQYSFGGRDDYLWNETIPTCFIEVSNGQYDVEQVCSTHEKAYEDYFYILGRKSFKIAVH
jgi:hypothetical protein